MYELNECLRITREIEKVREKLIFIKAAIQAPKNQIISDLPKGGNCPVSAIETYLEKEEKLQDDLRALKIERSEKWQAFQNIAAEKGVTKEDVHLMQLRFFRGYSWNKCTAVMRSRYGDKWNANRTFRVYRQVLSKCTKTSNDIC